MEPNPSLPPSAGHPGPLAGAEGRRDAGERGGKQGEKKEWGGQSSRFALSSLNMTMKEYLEIEKENMGGGRKKIQTMSRKFHPRPMC